MLRFFTADQEALGVSQAGRYKAILSSHCCRLLAEERLRLCSLHVICSRISFMFVVLVVEENVTPELSWRPLLDLSLCSGQPESFHLDLAFFSLVSPPPLALPSNDFTLVVNLGRRAEEVLKQAPARSRVSEGETRTCTRTA